MESIYQHWQFGCSNDIQINSTDMCHFNFPCLSMAPDSLWLKQALLDEHRGKMGLLLLPDRKHTTTASSKYPNRGWKIERKKNVAEFQTKLTMRNNVLFTSEHLKRPYTEMPFVEVKMSAFFFCLLHNNMIGYIFRWNYRRRFLIGRKIGIVSHNTRKYYWWNRQ